MKQSKATQARIERAAERHFDRMAEEFYGWDGPAPECSNCYWWDEDTGICDKRLAELSDDQDDAEAVTVATDYCTRHEPEEPEDDDDGYSDDAWERRFDE